jgi:F-type H+-transporting ATPase subunit epsilon
MPIKVEIVTAERVVFSDDVDLVLAPGLEGQLGILPHHAPLITTLAAGELLARKGAEEYSMVISGGFLEVGTAGVIILADTAERAEEIDIARAELAKKRAEERLSQEGQGVDHARATASLHRALARIEVAERRKKRKTSDVR